MKSRYADKSVRRQRLIRTLAICAVAGLMTACSSSGKTKPPPGANKSYPNLSNVPGSRPAAPSVQERIRVQEGLMADRDNARHADGPKAGDPVGTANNLQPVRPAIVTPPNRAAIAAQAAAARRARLNPRPALRVGRGGYVTTIAFPNGATALPAGSGARIVQIAELYRWSGGSIVLAAHSMTKTGDAASKRSRAIARANAVAAGLINLGVPRDKISILLLADTRPRFRDAARDGQNSRVDVLIRGARRR